MICPNCGHQNPSDARFCNQCGYHLVESRPPSASSPQSWPGPHESANRSHVVERERRVVSILFCDVKGSTSAAGQLDPEEWADIMNDVFERMIRPVYRYEGTIVRLLGDAILAFFGAPIAREDDPQRAVLAGLEIQENIQSYRRQIRQQWGVDFDVRCGINTGLVVVGAVGADVHLEYTALGDAVNVASRMEQTAQPGTIQITEETYKLIAPLFDTEDLGEVNIKGKDRPVRAYRVVGKRAAPGTLRGIEGVEAPLIGRDVEFSALESTLKGLEQGRGATLFLLGEAGLGKSRLIRELERSSHRINANIGWFKTSSFSYEMAQPYGQFQRLVRGACAIDGNDSPQIQRQKIRRLLAKVTVQEQEQSQQVLETLLGVEDESSGMPKLEGETFKRQLYSAMESLWHGWAAPHPIVLVFDDFQWADPASVELLGHLLPANNRVPILFLCAMRPSRHSPAWTFKIKVQQSFPSHYSEHELHPLSASDSELLVDSLLAVDKLPVNLRAQILEKTAGNPLFVEEVVRTLIGNDLVTYGSPDNSREVNRSAQASQRVEVSHAAEEIHIPDNLQSLLIARIDRLEPEVRQTLQLAAVIGRSFHLRVLSNVAGSDPALITQHMRILQEWQLIQEATTLPEQKYLFRHVLVHETAYAMILHRQRRQFHQRVGEALERLFPDRLEENTVVLAYHFDRARLYERARHYYRMAGDAAFRLYSLKEAIGHYSRALELAKQGKSVGTNGVTKAYQHLFLRKGRALELDNQFDAALATYGEMEVVAQQHKDRALELASLMARLPLYAVPTALYNPELGRTLGEQALVLARGLNNQEAEARLLWNLSNAYAQDNDLPRATEYGERSLTLARQLHLREQVALTLTDIGLFCYMAAGHFDKAMEALHEASQICRELNDLPMLANDLATLCLVCTLMGEYHRAIAYSEEAIQISQSINNLWGQSYSRFKVGYIYWEQGDPDRAIETITTCLQFGEQAGFLASQMEPRVDLAAIYGELGAVDYGLQTLSPVRQIPAMQHLPDRAYFLAVQAQLHLAQDNLVEAQRSVEECKRRHEWQTWPIYYLPFHMIEAAIALKQGDHPHALALTESLLASLRRIGMRSHIARALYLQAQALVGVGKKKLARERLQEAHSEATTMDARWILWQILALQAEIEPNPTRGEHLRQQARDVVKTITSNISDVELKASFLNLPEVTALTSESR